MLNGDVWLLIAALLPREDVRRLRKIIQSIFRSCATDDGEFSPGTVVAFLDEIPPSTAGTITAVTLSPRILVGSDVVDTVTWGCDHCDHVTLILNPVTAYHGEFSPVKPKRYITSISVIISVARAAFTLSIICDLEVRATKRVLWLQNIEIGPVLMYWMRKFLTQKARSVCVRVSSCVCRNDLCESFWLNFSSIRSTAEFVSAFLEDVAPMVVQALLTCLFLRTTCTNTRSVTLDVKLLEDGQDADDTVRMLIAIHAWVISFPHATALQLRLKNLTADSPETQQLVLLLISAAISHYQTISLTIVGLSPVHQFSEHFSDKLYQWNATSMGNTIRLST